MKAFLTSHYLVGDNISELQKLIGKEKADKALFVTAAAVPYGDSPRPEWLSESLKAMSQFAHEVDETTLEDDAFRPKSLAEYDFVFVSGGNVFYLAYRLEETGFGNMLKEYVASGGVYSGSSAGAIILMDDIHHFAQADDASKAPKLCPGLALTEYAIVPHADSPKYSELVTSVAECYRADGIDVVMLNDDQVLVIDGGDLRVVGSS